MGCVCLPLSCKSLDQLLLPSCSPEWKDVLDAGLSNEPCPWGQHGSLPPTASVPSLMLYNRQNCYLVSSRASPTCPRNMLEPVTSFALPGDCALPACTAALGDFALQSPSLAEEHAATQAKHKRVSRRQIQAPLKEILFPTE